MSALAWLKYSFEELLVSPANKAAVEEVLAALEEDCYEGTPEEHDAPLLKRLEELGETRILDELKH